MQAPLGRLPWMQTPLDADPTGYINKWAVRILLECILVKLLFLHILRIYLNFFPYIYIFNLMKINWNNNVKILHFKAKMSLKFQTSKLKYIKSVHKSIENKTNRIQKTPTDHVKIYLGYLAPPTCIEICMLVCRT